MNFTTEAHPISMPGTSVLFDTGPLGKQYLVDVKGEKSNPPPMVTTALPAIV